MRDGNTLQLGDITYRLEGIDAPELDQTCINDQADPWTCGLDARDQLIKIIGGRVVRCDDLGPDKVYQEAASRPVPDRGRDREPEPASGTLRLCAGLRAVGQGALPAGRGAAPRDAKRGLWRGCFVAPEDFRLGNERTARCAAAPAAPTATGKSAPRCSPRIWRSRPSCSIKGKFAVRARVTGNVGIYHLQGCPSYAGTTRAGPLVLHRGRRAGRRLPPRLQLPPEGGDEVDFICACSFRKTGSHFSGSCATAASA